MGKVWVKVHTPRWAEVKPEPGSVQKRAAESFAAELA